METFKGKDDPVVSCCSFGVAAMTMQVPWANRERWRAPKENLEVVDEDGSIWWRLQGVSCKALHTESVCVPCAINVWVCLKLPGTAELGVLAPALPSGHLVASSPRTPRDTGGTFQHCCDLPPPAPFPDHGVVFLFHQELEFLLNSCSIRNSCHGFQGCVPSLDFAPHSCPQCPTPPGA